MASLAMIKSGPAVCRAPCSRVAAAPRQAIAVQRCGAAARTAAPRTVAQPQGQRRTSTRMASMAGGMSPELKASIDEFISKNKIVVFMKGDRQQPQCGFSAKVVQVLTVMDVPYETVNILADERLRSGMKEYSMWPTFPQVYINGEFFGGADIVMEAAQNGQLKEALEVAFME